MLDVFFDKWWRLGGVMGILFLILLIVGIGLQGETPNYDDSVDKIRDWYADNGKQFILGNYLTALAFVLFFLPFLSSLRALLARAEGGDAIWSRVTFTGGVVLLLLCAVGSTFGAALAFSLDVVKEGDEDTLRTLKYLEYSTPAALALVPFLLGTSIVILRSGVLWRWLAIAGVVLAILAVIGGASSLEAEPYGGIPGIGMAAFPLSALWILLVSINMVLKKEAPAAA